MSTHPTVSFIDLLDNFHAWPRGTSICVPLRMVFACNLSQTLVKDIVALIFAPIGFSLWLAHWGGTLGSKMEGHT